MCDKQIDIFWQPDTGSPQLQRMIYVRTAAGSSVVPVVPVAPAHNSSLLLLTWLMSTGKLGDRCTAVDRHSYAGTTAVTRVTAVTAPCGEESEHTGILQRLRTAAAVRCPAAALHGGSVQL